MAVPSQIPYNLFTANGVTTVFPFGFMIFDARDLVVSLNGTTLTSGFTVSGVGEVNGGAVTFLTPPAAGVVLMNARVMQLARQTEYQDNGDLLADTVNQDFDRIWMVLQGQGVTNSLALSRPSVIDNHYAGRGYRITDIADPVGAQDAVNNRSMRSYVEQMVAGVVGGFGWFTQFGMGAIQRTFQDKMRDSISVKDFGAKGDGATDDTVAFISAGKGAYVPEGTYFVGTSVDVKYYWGPGKLKYPTLEERWVGLSSKGTLYIRNDDTNLDGTPNVPTDGLINLADGELRFLCDLDGDGDYDADIHGKNNLYISADNSIHLRVSPQQPAEGRLRIAATTNTNFIQSGKDYDGNVIKNFALSAYLSTNYWFFIHSTDGYIGIGNNSSPAAPLHIYKDATTGQLVENTAGVSSRVAFKGSASTTGTSVTIGCDSDDLAMRAGGVERLRVLSAGTVRPGADNTQNLGSSSFRFGTVFAGTGSINTSDEDEKYFIPIDERVLDIWEVVSPWKTFIFSDALDKKEGGARIHFGVGAQSIAAQFITAGLDPTNYAFFCYDEWEDHYEDIYETVETESGFKEVMVERRLIMAAGSRYGIRYDEAFAIEAACSRRKISRLEARMEALEKAV
ncbi:phage tail fiber domain-containing protein [Yersinia mollaretii]|uniref:phage tail fiber domain-containing protein n=1 Tax=Yersinia mollaretii TaxID=33060 RepID=UPI001643C51A|nr:phage tail fiber protein [Yersinia mollaretii]